MSPFERFLEQLPVANVLPVQLQRGRKLILDLTTAEWSDAATLTVEQLTARTENLLQQAQAVIAIGRYAEDRTNLYARSPLFKQQAALRSLHLGIDLTVPVGTPIFSPLSGTIHSFADHAAFGDYGPTTIVQHEVGSQVFYTLYGHLSRCSLQTLAIGQALIAGEQFAAVGNQQENGCWPPHLHFQIIKDLQGNCGGYPGVTSLAQAPYYLTNCPDPNLLLRLDT